jgi:hypothetical protein
MKIRPPTDLQLLESIYDNYYPTFISFEKEKPSRESKIYVPIDIAEISRDFHIDSDIIFGRLYYDLDKKYSYIESNGVSVRFFLSKADTPIKKDMIQFPFLASVYASLRDEKQKFITTTWLSVIALIISGVATLVAIFLR